MCKHKDTRPNGKMGATDIGWGVEGEECVRACAFLCVVVSSLISYINSLENKKRDLCVSLLTQLPDNEQLKNGNIIDANCLFLFMHSSSL